MVTQILYGELYEVLEYLPGWQHVELAFDGYRGWIDQKMGTPVSQRRYEKLRNAPCAVTTDIFSLVPVTREQTLCWWQEAPFRYGVLISGSFHWMIRC